MYFCEVRISGGVHQVVVGHVGSGNLLSDGILVECELSVTFFVFFLPYHMCHSQGCSYLSHSPLDQDSGALGSEQNQSLWHLGVMFTVL